MGRPIIRVSRVLTQIFGNTFNAVPFDTLQEAMKRGTYFHDLAKQIMLARQFPEAHPFHVSLFPNDAHIIHAIQDWADKNSVVPLLIEERLIHPKLYYSGTPDLVCLINEKVVVVDFKFTAAIMLANKVQVVAYKHLVELIRKVDRMCIVRFDPYTGELEEEEVYAYGHGHWALFLGGLQGVLNCTTPGE